MRLRRFMVGIIAANQMIINHNMDDCHTRKNRFHADGDRAALRTNPAGGNL